MKINKPSAFPHFGFHLPEWIPSVLPPPGHIFRSDEEKMKLAISLAHENIRQNTGGPFGAVIYNRDTGELVAPGVNIVIPMHWSGGHAEMVAFAIAQQNYGTHDLGGEGMPFCELFSSTEPCAMCLGATPWSGVRRLVCGARDEDARQTGFDEGMKPPDWVKGLESRGIGVTRDLLREDAAHVMKEYVRLGKPVYNARNSRP